MTSSYTKTDDDTEVGSGGYPSNWDDSVDDIDIGDLSAVPTTDVIDTARKVLLDIRAASLDTQEYSLDDEGHLKKWAKVNLKLQLAVSSLGIDGEGKYAGKVFFDRILLKVNKEDFPDSFSYDKYEPTGKAWRPIKQFWLAMGSDDAKNVKVSKDWIASLVGQQVVADIVKRAQRQQVNGEWVDGELQNTIENYRRAQTAEGE